MSTPFLPPQRPRITREQALKLAGLPADFDGFAVIGIRGYYWQDSKDNKRGVNDDALVVVGREHFSAYNGNVDPSIFRPGIASLKPGVHPYKPGNHGISGGNPYPAFRPATKNEELPVTRDGITNPRPGVAINIHRGGRNSTSSEGCQTIPPDQWAAFHATVHDQLKRHGLKTFNYHLIHP